MNNKEYWIHKAILKEDAEVPNKKNKINITEHILDLIGDVGTSSTDKVSITGDTMTGSLSLPSMVLNGNTINSISTDEIDNSGNKLPTNSAVYLLHNTHANNQTNPHNVTKEQLNLSNVDNTSDLNKPISTATQTVLDGKVSKTGNESISGLKSFTDGLSITNTLTHVGSTTNVLNVGGSFSVIPSNFLSGLVVDDAGVKTTNLDTNNFTFRQGSGVIYTSDTIDLNDSADSDQLASALSIKNYVDSLQASDVGAETTAQLNTRDLNNRNRSNHTGVQLASTISNFQTKVLEYEHTGFKKGGNAPATLVADTSYFLNGLETTLTLPVITSAGERVQLISNTTTSVRVYPQTGKSLAGVINGSYDIINKGDVIVFYSDGADNWYIKNVGKEVTTGWASYVDNIYTLSSPLTVSSGVESTLTNNAFSGLSYQLPSDAVTFWDNTNNKLIGINNGDKYNIEIRFKAQSTSNNDNFDLSIDIGGAIGIVNKKTCIFVKAANTEQDFTETFNYYTASTFLSNGGDIKVKAGIGTLSIYDISFLITRTHKGV